MPPMIVEKLSEPIKRRLKDITHRQGIRRGRAISPLDAALVSGEVFTLVTEINELRDSDKQVEYIKALRDNLYRDRIQGTGGGTFTRKGMGPKQRLNLALSNIGGVNWDDMETVSRPTSARSARRPLSGCTRPHSGCNDLAKVLTS